MAEVYEDVVFSTAEAAAKSPILSKGKRDRSVFRVVHPESQESVYVVAISPTEAVGRVRDWLGVVCQRADGAPPKTPLERLLEEIDGMTEEQRAKLQKALAPKRK